MTCQNCGQSKSARVYCEPCVEAYISQAEEEIARLEKFAADVVAAVVSTVHPQNAYNKIGMLVAAHLQENARKGT